MVTSATFFVYPYLISGLTPVYISVDKKIINSTDI